MGRNHLCEQAVPEDPAHLLARPCGPERPSGLSFGFPKLFPSRRQLDYVLLARPPLYSPCGFRVRLACLIHAANVRSEPGSNPSLERSVQFSCRFSRQPRPAGWLSALNSTPLQPTSKLADRKRSQTQADSLTRYLSRPPRMSKIVPHRPVRLTCEGGRK